MCETEATTQLVWLDAYMNSSIFHRLFSDVLPTVSVTLVTENPNEAPTSKNMRRFNELLDISRLFAQERPDTYSLVVHNPKVLHDRWAVFDSKRIFSLGGSAKDACDKSYFTVSTVEATPVNLSCIANHVSSGTEYFGRTQTTHS